MKTLLCFLSLLICLCIAQRTAFNDFSDWRYARCVNATPGDTICFNSLSWIYPSWTIFPNEPNFITDVGEDVDPQYRDFCNNPIVNGMVNGFNATCISYFCPGTDTSAQRQYMLRALTYNYPNGSESYKEFIKYTDIFHLSDHNIFTNYCYYCNHKTRQQFREALANGTCIYVWRHSNPTFCGSGDGINEVVAALDTRLGYSMNRAALYLNYATKFNSNFTTFSVQNFTEMLTLTVFRNARKDYEGELSRGENMYLCYCYTFGRLGSSCDGYTSFLIPFKYLALPYLTIFAKFFFFLVIAWLNLIPLFYRDASQYLKKNSVDVKKFLFTFFGDLKVQAVILMSIAVLIGILEEPAYLVLNDPNNHYPAINGLFRSLSYFLTGLCCGTLLVLWSHIYESTNNMSVAEGLSKKHKFALALLYLILGSIIFLAVVGIIAIAIASVYVQGIFQVARGYLFTILLVIAIIFMLLFALGFLIYGINMFRVIKQIEVDVKVWDKKFMKFMIIADILFVNFCCWLLIVMVNDASENILGEFMTLFAVYILDLNIFFLYCVVIFLLYDSKLYWSISLNQLICCCCNKTEQEINI